MPALAPLPVKTMSLGRGVNDAGTLRPTDAAGAPLPAWRVLAVLVDTGDATWPTTVSPSTPAPTVDTAKTTWRDVLTGTGGVDAFYREMSGGRLGISLVGGAVQGPVSLGKTWTDWFDQDAASKQWIAKDDVLTRVVGALQNKGIDWTKVDAVFMVVRSVSGMRFVWPRAGSRVYSQKVKTPAGKDADVLVSRVAMPHDQTTAPGLGFTNVEVSAHEIGHTVGLDDLYMDTGYTDQMKKRALGNRELMGNESGLPHLTARHKLLLGFLDPGHVRSFSYDVDADETFDLHPVAAGLPPAGRSSVVELKVAPKVSWFFEFRQAVAGKLGDGSAFAGGQVMGYDAWTYKDPPVSANARRPIILLLDDGDGEGTVIVQGQDYEVLEADNPSHLSTFRLEVVSVAAGVARVRVVVRRVKQPDPSIRNNAGAPEYKSQDIEIRNELSDKDPAWLNKPVIGVNRVVAKVTNIGDLPAPDVVVRFKVLPFNTDDPDSERWQELGEPVKHSIPAGKTVEFQTEWAPTGNRHHCVQARIDRYTRIPGAAADEPDVDNNLAQSNYFEVFSKPSSPATRETSLVDVHNPFDHAVSATVELRQDVAGYRSYVDHRWVRLAAGETRSVRVEVESKATSIWDAVEHDYPDGRTWLRTWLEAPGLGDTARTGSGVTLGVVTAVATTVRVAEHAPGYLLLRVESPAGAPPPHEGSVALQVDYEDGGRDVLVGAVDAFGQVTLRPLSVGGRGTLSFSGARGYAPVDGIEVEVERA
jgi:M6 family metalloprotease-like protein